MRIFIDGIKYYMENDPPVSAEWIVYVSTTTGLEDVEIFRSIEDTKNILSISITLVDPNGNDIKPEELTDLYADVKLNYKDVGETEFKRFKCIQSIQEGKL